METLGIIVNEEKTIPASGNARMEGAHLAASIIFLHSVHFPHDKRLGRAVIDAALYASGERTDEELAFAQGMARAVVWDTAFVIPGGTSTLPLVAAMFAAHAVVAACASDFDLDAVQHAVKKALHYDEWARQQVAKLH